MFARCVLAAAYIALAYRSAVVPDASALRVAAVLHMAEALVVAWPCLGHNVADDEMPVVFRAEPWIEVPEHLGHALLLCLLALGCAGPIALAGTGGTHVTLCVTLPSVHAAVRLVSDCLVRRRAVQIPALLVAGTLLLIARCATYMAFDCVAFALHVLEIDPAYAALLPPPAAVGVRIVCCMLAYAKLIWAGRATAFTSALCM